MVSSYVRCDRSVLVCAARCAAGETRIAPVLVAVTAACWVLLMVGAMITHGRRGESTLVMLNLGYLALAVFIAWGRFGPGSFTG